MTTLIIPPSPGLANHRKTTPPPSSHHLALNATLDLSPPVAPNRRIPYCSPGVQPLLRLQTPPTTPPRSADAEFSSLLYPPDRRALIVEYPPIYGLTAAALAAAREHLALRPLPDPQAVFPWLHGLHPENQLQLSYFTARKRSLRKTPTCLRGLTIVKAGGDLSSSKLEGALSPDEIIRYDGPEHKTAHFLNADPQSGFSVRNFHIQAAKLAQVSDIVVYGDADALPQQVEELALAFSSAQETWRQHCDNEFFGDSRRFNTFVITDSFDVFERSFPGLVAIDSLGLSTGKVLDLNGQEREEMTALSRPSEIAQNVWLGSTGSSITSDVDGVKFDVIVEARDYVEMPGKSSLAALDRFLQRRRSSSGPACLTVCSSGSIAPHSWTSSDKDQFLTLCRWIHAHATSSKTSNPKLKFLLCCTDGYTETTLFALAYFMFAERVPLHKAWLTLHTQKRREFFAYTADKLFLQSLEPTLLECSTGYSPSSTIVPDWMDKMDGSLPSRILPYLYLGNLTHAQNPALLKAMGIERIVSVGEPIEWGSDLPWDPQNLLFIDNVQDNGVDGLTEVFERCLNFIRMGREQGSATLVHCRVGVSRSATICIAEVMNETGLCFPRAYCFVRARRLNVIIQPHLRFAYELCKWEEFQCEKKGLALRREVEWSTLAHQIALLNKPYCKQ